MDGLVAADSCRGVGDAHRPRRQPRGRIPAAERGAPVYSVATYDQFLTFYLQRPVTLVRYRGELDYGLRKAPDAGIADEEEFLRRWSLQSQASW